MTDRTGLRSISTIRSMTGLPSRRPRSSVALVRPAQRRNDRFRASISAHAGLGAHVRRHARLGVRSFQRDPAGPYYPYAGLPLILRRFLRRQRSQPAGGGPVWPAARAPFHGSPSPDVTDGITLEESSSDTAGAGRMGRTIATIAATRASIPGGSRGSRLDATGGDDPGIQLDRMPWTDSGDQERFDAEARDAEFWGAEATAPPPAPDLITSLTQRHAGFLGRDVLPAIGSQAAPAFHVDAVRFGSALPLAVPYQRAGASGKASLQAPRVIVSPLPRPGAGLARVIDQRLRASEYGALEEPFLASSAASGRSAPAPASRAGPSPIEGLSRPVQRRGLATSRGIPPVGAGARLGLSMMPLARQVVARHAPDRERELVFGASRDGDGHPQPALAMGARAGGMFGHSLGASRPLRRLFAMAGASVAAQGEVDTPLHTALGYLDSSKPWTPIRATHAARRPGGRVDRSASTDTYVNSSLPIRDVDTHLLAQAMSRVDQNPGMAIPVLTPFAAFGAVGTDQAGGDDRPMVNRAGRVVVTRSAGGGRTEGQGATVSQRFETLRHRLLNQPDNRPLMGRLIAHDEPFAPTMRRMHAMALTHILRRLPPTAGAPSLAAMVARQQQSSWPQKPAAQPASAESAQANRFHALGGSFLLAPTLPSSTRPPFTTGFGEESIAGPGTGATPFSTLARWFAHDEPEPSASLEQERPARPRMAAPLLARIRRMPSGFDSNIDQPAASGARAAWMPGETSRGPVSQPQPLALQALLRRSPAAISRALADLLGEAPSAAALPRAGQAFTRRPPINATFAPVFPGSTLPAPASRPTSWHASASAALTAPIAGGVDVAFDRRSVDPHSEETGLPPFVTRQISRAVNDLRVASKMPLSMTLLRAATSDGATGMPSLPSRSIGLPVPTLLPTRALRRSRDDGGVIRPQRVASSRSDASNPLDTGALFTFLSQSRQSVLPGMRAGTLAGMDTLQPIGLEDSWPGFPMPNRRQVMPRRVSNAAHTGSAPSPALAIDRFFASVRRTPFERSPIHHIFRRTPPGTSAGPATGSDDGAASGSRPDRGQSALLGPTTLGTSRAAGWSPFLGRILHQPAALVDSGPGPLVFRSALPAAGDPTVMQRAQAAEAMASSTGQPLPPMVRRSMERLFRMDLASVRVHSGPQAARATDLVAARAMASGANVFLPGGISDSARGDDLPLLAHELTHVAHHFGRRAPSSPPAAPLTLAHRTASTEQDAEHVERMVAETIRRQPAAASAPADLTLARKPAPVTIMRVDDASPAPAAVPSGPATTTAASPAQETGAPGQQSTQDQQKLADQIFHMLEQRLIIARERGGHRL